MKRENKIIGLVFFVAFTLICCLDKKTNKDATDRISMFDYALAFNVLVDEENDNYEVFTMNLDGTEKKNITNLKGVEWTYFSCNDKVYFISDADTCYRCFFLYETDFRVEARRKVSDIRLADSWMSARKDGLELIVLPHKTVDSAFYIIDLNGEIIQRLETGLPCAADPLFVNNGTQIIFRGGQTKSKLIDGFNEELYIIDVDGGNRRQLTHYPPGDTSAGKFAYHAGTPKLHPSGQYVTFQSSRNGKYSLFAVDIEGHTGEWKLTEGIQAEEGWHDWSPDGKWLAIELFDREQTQFHIGLMDWETKEINILTDTAYQYQHSPNFVLKK